MKSKRATMINLAAVSMIVGGIVLLVVAAQLRSRNAHIQAQPALTAENSSAKVIKERSVAQGKPTALTIPEAGISNSVVDGVFDPQSGQWTLTLDKVQHAVMTYQPNNSHGLTFMYGHNRRGVFAQLPALKKGAIAEVKTSNGHTFYYRFRSSRVTSPDDISVFSYQGPPILVLQTCTGIFFQNRQLFTFDFIGVDGHA